MVKGPDESCDQGAPVDLVPVWKDAVRGAWSREEVVIRTWSTASSPEALTGWPVPESVSFRSPEEFRDNSGTCVELLPRRSCRPCPSVERCSARRVVKRGRGAMHSPTLPQIGGFMWQLWSPPASYLES